MHESFLRKECNFIIVIYKRIAPTEQKNKILKHISLQPVNFNSCILFTLFFWSNKNFRCFRGIEPYGQISGALQTTQATRVLEHSRRQCQHFRSALARDGSTINAQIVVSQVVLRRTRARNFVRRFSENVFDLEKRVGPAPAHE